MQSVYRWVNQPLRASWTAESETFRDIQPEGVQLFLFPTRKEGMSNSADDLVAWRVSNCNCCSVSLPLSLPLSGRFLGFLAINFAYVTTLLYFLSWSWARYVSQNAARMNLDQLLLGLAKTTTTTTTTCCLCSFCLAKRNNKTAASEVTTINERKTKGRHQFVSNEWTHGVGLSHCLWTHWAWHIYNTHLDRLFL